ncbi:hypothetical protein [Kitasatospora sp. GAS204B]|uniref:hypothetical protein n=1 Tax=unclassified Kitasatospora TaxID=2633591 RepID=UPI002475780F|nr:hypothetical protein [Kitasatospora sp. GAS204B]MDH6119739.1 hypothetical protein [Kitasatospora sp. GAS204B]
MRPNIETNEFIDDFAEFTADKFIQKAVGNPPVIPPERTIEFIKGCHDFIGDRLSENGCLPAKLTFRPTAGARADAAFHQNTWTTNFNIDRTDPKEMNWQQAALAAAVELHESTHTWNLFQELQGHLSQNPQADNTAVQHAFAVTTNRDEFVYAEAIDQARISLPTASRDDLRSGIELYQADFAKLRKKFPAPVPRSSPAEVSEAIGLHATAGPSEHYKTRDPIFTDFKESAGALIAFVEAPDARVPRKNLRPYRDEFPDHLRAIGNEKLSADFEEMCEEVGNPKLYRSLVKEHLPELFHAEHTTYAEAYEQYYKSPTEIRAYTAENKLLTKLGIPPVRVPEKPKLLTFDKLSRALMEQPSTQMEAPPRPTLMRRQTHMSSTTSTARVRELSGSLPPAQTVQPTASSSGSTVSSTVPPRVPPPPPPRTTPPGPRW